MGPGKSVARHGGEKPSKDVKEERVSENPYCQELGHRRTEEPGRSQVLSQSGEAAGLQE